MHHHFVVINNISFLLIKNTLLDMTINNPIFIFAVITVIWFTPGILVRRFKEQKDLNKKKKLQDLQDIAIKLEVSNFKELKKLDLIYQIHYHHMS